MNGKDKCKLMTLIYTLQNCGVSNSMVKQYFDPSGDLRLHKKQNWQSFIDEHINLIDSRVGKKPEIRVKKHEYLTK
jgi:hypothetical protein